MRGRGNPVSGIGSPERVDSSMGTSVGVGAMVAEGVASPKTCVPLFNTSNMCVNATGLPCASCVVSVTLCRPAESGVVGEYRQIPSFPTVVWPTIGLVMPIISVTFLFGMPVP